MQNNIIRIKQVELLNFKNVEKGTIIFPNHIKHSSKKHQSEIVGIYGQNGSGKTALVDAMWILKHIISGQEIPENSSDFIFRVSETAIIKIELELNSISDKYTVFYEVELKRIADQKALITRENLSFKEFLDGAWKSKVGIINYDINYDDTIFKPVKNFKLLTGNNSDTHINLGVAKKLCEKNFTSFIFSDETEEIIKKNTVFGKYTKIIEAVKQYARINLFILRNSYSGLINMNPMIHLDFRLKNEEKFTQSDLGISLLEPSVIEKAIYNLVSKVLDQMNIVLETLIPGLNIGIENHGKQLTKGGDTGIRIELISIRDGIKIPLKYESDGAKKIISILSALITMFNNPSVCIIVDELDVSVFEYLLGEILETIKEHGKGQLVFTSHNLRALEVLDTNSIIFTTTNPKNRYTRFTHVKRNNNLRDLYIRSINLGGQKEELCKETNSFDISRAFRTVGRLRSKS